MSDFIYCPNCETKSDGDLKKCPKCGYPNVLKNHYVLKNIRGGGIYYFFGIIIIIAGIISAIMSFKAGIIYGLSSIIGSVLTGILFFAVGANKNEINSLKCELEKKHLIETKEFFNENQEQNNK